MISPSAASHRSMAFNTLSAASAMPVGIPRELARERAERVSDVRYQLRYTLVPKAAETLGHEEIRFQLKVAEDAPCWIFSKDRFLA